MIELKLPALGENITKATVSFWYLKENDTVSEGQEIVEVCTDKATFNIPSPCLGVITKILVKEGELVEVGKTLAVIE